MIWLSSVLGVLLLYAIWVLAGYRQRIEAALLILQKVRNPHPSVTEAIYVLRGDEDYGKL